MGPLTNKRFLFVAVMVLLLCHGAPGVSHETAHFEVPGAHHGVSVQPGVGHAGGADAAQIYSPIAANYSMALLVLTLGVTALLVAARVSLHVLTANAPRPLARRLPGWRPPPAPTPVLLQVFRI
jgi:cadmium resistance protein CadD (predicted permease)